MNSKNFKLSIIVVSNNREILNSMLLNSLDKQSYKNYELIIVDGSKYTSARDAYTFGATKAKGQYLLFIHHDITFETNDTLYDMMKYVHLLDKGYAVLGFAGIVEGQDCKPHRLMTMKNGSEGVVYSFKELLKDEEVFSIDECGFFIKKELFRKIGFSDLGDTWHFYAVELCLNLKSQGYRIGVIPVSVWHHSLGNLNYDYYRVLRKVVRLYRYKFPKIYTTCVSVDSTKLFYDFFLAKRQFHLWLNEHLR